MVTNPVALPIQVLESLLPDFPSSVAKNACHPPNKEQAEALHNLAVKK